MIDWDEEYMVPVNWHTWTIDMNEANKTPDQELKWYEQHDGIKEYGLKDLSPSSMKDLANRMYNDVDLASEYKWNMNRRPGAKPKIPLHNKMFKCEL